MHIILVDWLVGDHVLLRAGLCGIICTNVRVFCYNRCHGNVEGISDFVFLTLDILVILYHSCFIFRKSRV
jgi:hypothetical protein